ncbi:hypothetical protein AA103196_2090 [Ameyamaea chiangmaiensis NBRC 103196]|uniref:DUF2721 domain-containing protein n=1 Tax=Ameyamaea chiangmaiensis TaxID=442969 RepID=A0A850P559_9PROT|nr:DUF2721 domain-containing protein [Ameyamaea chiangmaiensis]MBS4073644.1 DUF2721 domain-containing protein [Ameyamaea chiangmaiensis]NVN39088.1 DUF2721 domain-containing protein [Ameyamaea chiangmaiensis]GBQ68953.1 hypothetical protein AA103196_2090 [Ameyamaea chiangmaiensis NBRC 103196]
MNFPFSTLATDSVGDLAHLIQTALTPVFMLSGIGTLLNLFNTRLARVSDHMEKIDDQITAADADADILHLLRRLVRLRRRVVMLDASILFGGCGGAATCGAALVLFMGSVRDSAHGSWLVAMFGAALLFTVLALAFFLGDSLLGWHFLHTEGPLRRTKEGVDSD